MHEAIKVRGAREHNLKNINVDIPRNKLVVITGVSGCGKTSLARDTIFAEGQRRYVESFSAYARQFLEIRNKPDVDSIEGLSPAIAIDQKTTSRNPRSTVGTTTEIHDYLRLLFARVGTPYSPVTGKPIESRTASQIIEEISALEEGSKIYILAPLVRGGKGEHRKELLSLKKQGFEKVQINDEIYELDDLPVIDKNKKNDIELIVDRLIIKQDLGNRIANSVETALKIGNGIIYVKVMKESDENSNNKLIFSEKFACPVSGFQLGEIEPRMFSFNSPYGACEVCEGLGTESYFDPDLIVPDKSLSLEEGAILPWAQSPTKFQRQTLENLAAHYKFSLHRPFSELPAEIQQIVFYGSNDEKIEMCYNDGFKREVIVTPFIGIIPSMERRWKESNSVALQDELTKYQNSRKCSYCKGYRLKDESLCVKIQGKHIGEVSDMTLIDTYNFFESLPRFLTSMQNKIAERIIKEIKERLVFLMNVGLEYLTLSRAAGTLSGGESQRARLACQLGSGLTGVLYVLDEPSIGLHPRDTARLITVFQSLRDLGNTVMVVEHDEKIMLYADWIVDIGVGAGVHGGSVVATGTPEQVQQNEQSITGQYLSGRKAILIPQQRRIGHTNRFIELKGATSHNLQNVDIKIPLGIFCCVTGVSGSGKSTLIMGTLYKAAIRKLEKAKVTPGEYKELNGLEYIDKIIKIDQSPIGRTPRSNPATYTGAFTLIRDLFVELPASKARGYKPGRFSFNVKGGRCETCQGDGLIKIEMHFLPDIYIECEECKGQRYNKETLEVKYKDKSIADILDMTVEEGVIFFEKVHLIRDKMSAMMEVGLGYIKIGQSATTLSGGEAQRIKLAKELTRHSTGKTLYLLDEPTTGLHSDDIRKLLNVLHKLVDKGNTVLVIEHSVDVMKTADLIIDIGPEGGDKGGKLVVFGTPEDIIKCEESITGQYLKPYLFKGVKCAV
jgi:excinuclease ABC subunit A